MRKRLSKFFFTCYFSSKGFTLVELLIVIAILGILATAVLAAINPIEQINRGRDTGTQSDAEQLLGAIARFDAAQGYFPWQIGAGDTGHVATGWTQVANGAGGWTVDNGGSTNVLDAMGTAGGGTQEIQSAFIQRVTATTSNPLFVYNQGDQGSSTYICFKPQSKQFLTNAVKRWNGGSACVGVVCGCTGVPADLSTASVNVCDKLTADNHNTYYCLP